MRLISVEKDWKHVSIQYVVTLNTCYDIACLTVQMPHNTTGSFQSHQRQSTTGSFRASNVWKNATDLQSDEKVLQFSSECGDIFSWEGTSGLQFVFFWDNKNNQKCVWIILLKMTFFGFPKVKWLHTCDRWGEQIFNIFMSNFLWIFPCQKSLKSVNFWQNY